MNNAQNVDTGSEKKSPSELKWEGRWDQLVGKVKGMWSEVTDDDIQKAQGNYRELIGVIKEKIGKSLEEIEELLEKED